MQSHVDPISDTQRPRRSNGDIARRRATSLDEQHSRAAIRAQPIRHDAAARTGPDDDEVVFRGGLFVRTKKRGGSDGGADGVNEMSAADGHAESAPRNVTSRSSRASTRSRPSNTSISNKPGLTIRPVMAMRVA